MLLKWQHHVHNPMGPKKPAPFALNLPLSAHNENTAAGDATMPSTQPEVHSHQAGQAQAKTLRRPYHRAKAREIADSGSAPFAFFPRQKLKMAPVSPLGSRICKEALWNLEFAAHEAP
jgi:hypothetical protein